MQVDQSTLVSTSEPISTRAIINVQNKLNQLIQTMLSVQNQLSTKQLQITSQQRQIDDLLTRQDEIFARRIALETLRCRCKRAGEWPTLNPPRNARPPPNPARPQPTYRHRHNNTHTNPNKPNNPNHTMNLLQYLTHESTSPQVILLQEARGDV